MCASLLSAFRVIYKPTNKPRTTVSSLSKRQHSIFRISTLRRAYTTFSVSFCTYRIHYSAYFFALRYIFEIRTKHLRFLQSYFCFQDTSHDLIPPNRSLRNFCFLQVLSFRFRIPSGFYSRSTTWLLIASVIKFCFWTLLPLQDSSHSVI